jgi:hypothetical protein
LFELSLTCSFQNAAVSTSPAVAVPGVVQAMSVFYLSL